MKFFHLLFGLGVGLILLLSGCIDNATATVAYNGSTYNVSVNNVNVTVINNTDQNNTPGNNAPEVIEPALAPIPAYKSSTLKATSAYSDDDNDAGTVYFQWYVNDATVYNQTIKSVKAGTIVTTTLPSAYMMKSNIVKVSVRAFDEKDYSIERTSSALTILNTLPTITKPTIYPIAPQLNENLNASTKYSDGDADSGKVTFRWYINGANVYNQSFDSLNSSSTVTSTMQSNYIKASDLVYVSVIAYDGENYSSSKSSAAVIISGTKNQTSNTPPALSNITLSPNPAYDNDTLVANAIFTDTDDDLGTVAFMWYVNDVNKYNQTMSDVSNGSIAISTLLPTYFTASDNVYASISANDGKNSSLTVQTSVAIINAHQNNQTNTTNQTNVTTNSIPLVTKPGIQPSTAYANDTLVTSTTYTDVDMDLGTIYFRWYVNNANVYNESKNAVINGSSGTSALVYNVLHALDVVYVSVMAYDGKNYSLEQTSNSITIQQTPQTNQSNQTQNNTADLSKLQGIVTHVDLSSLPNDVTDYSGRTAYYVATTGSDSNTGTISAPFKTLTYAVAQVPSNSIIYVRGGTYKTTILRFTKSNVAMVAYPGETVTLQQQNPSSSWNWDDDVAIEITGDVNNIIIDGLTIDNFPVGIIYGAAQTQENLVFKNLNIKGATDKGIGNNYPGSRSAYLVKGLLIKNVNVTGLRGIGIECGDEQYKCAQNVLIQNAAVYGASNNPDNTGADTLAMVETDNVLVLDSVFTNAPGDGLDFKATKVSVVNTKALNPNRNGMKFWHDGEMINCIVSDSGADAAVVFDHGAAGSEFRMINSVVARHLIDWSPDQRYSYAMTVGYDARKAYKIEMKNNIIYDMPGPVYINQESTMDIQNNVFYQFIHGNEVIEVGSGANRMDVGGLNAKNYAEGNLYADPKFKSASTFDFTLLSGSPAINAGLSGSKMPTFDILWKTRPQGSGIDIGAYEN